MTGKPVAEQEIGSALLQEIVAYAETSMSRRKFILHYFGEEFDEVHGEGADMDDNARNPKPKEEAMAEVVKLLSTVRDTNEKFKAKEIVRILVGKTNAMISSHKTDEKPFFGSGADRDKPYWMALVRQVLVAGLLHKEIERYGILHLTDAGRAYLKEPHSFLMTKDHTYTEESMEAVATASKMAGAVMDGVLLKLLRDLRKREAAK